jgi:hypothetical protein
VVRQTFQLARCGCTLRVTVFTWVHNTDKYTKSMHEHVLWFIAQFQKQKWSTLMHTRPHFVRTRTWRKTAAIITVPLHGQKLWIVVGKQSQGHEKNKVKLVSDY